MSDDVFATLGARKKRRWVYVIPVVLVVAVGGAAWARKRSRPKPSNYLTAVVRRGDIEETVETSGTVQPLLQVQVGSQVSGRVARVYVDFNARVVVGQPIADIDPTSFRAAVAQARAALLSAEAQQRRARVNERVSGETLHRAVVLRAQGLNSLAEVEQARGQHDLAAADIAVSAAEIARARAVLSTAETNLSYTHIRAPISGMVIQRSVDEGQTVAASLQAPVLFVIANDLTRMRIIANVDEADISHLHEHMSALARVDAFPGESFRGELTELRYGSVTTAGVVTYPAVVTVANPDLKLRPGMTATLRVTSNRRSNVLRVPNAALRYHPTVSVGGSSGRSSGRSAGHPAGRGPGRSAEEPIGSGRLGAVYIVRNNRAQRVAVRIGISDETLTEVSGEGLSDGAAVILDETDAASSAPPAGGSPGGGARGRGRMF